MERVGIPLHMDAPAVYAIRVQGRVEFDWSDRLAGMQIFVSPDPPGAYTQLVGRLSDQSELLGVVNSLFNLGFPILEVCLLSGSLLTFDNIGRRR
jgi:hypothetical protein